MEPFNNRVYNYVRVDGDYLRNHNENTKRIWDDAIQNGVKDIIDITEKDDREKVYLIDTSIYHNLLQASREGDKVDPYGIPNVNFSLIERSDKRWNEFYEQRMERGFDSSELWSLDCSICNFIIPRLKAFKEEHGGYPAALTEEEWDDILDKMIKGFEYIVNDKMGFDNRIIKDRQKIINEGLSLFVKYFQGLWW